MKRENVKHQQRTVAKLAAAESIDAFVIAERRHLEARAPQMRLFPLVPRGYVSEVKG